MQPNNGIVVIATRNKGKVKEFALLFESKGIEVRSLSDYPDIPPIIEDGATFADNARIKAVVTARHLKVPVLADDSGLCVDALGGEPGVYSARYAGEEASDADNNRKLLHELGQLNGADGAVGSAAGSDGLKPKMLSSGRFVCALCMADAAGNVLHAIEEACEGEIIAAPRGDGGFGYDPLFWVPALGKTMAELTADEKNANSHRGRAMRVLWERL
jgi:XTP/dITP diphosphohydrolase